MSNNKKFSLILTIFLVIPNILVWLSPIFENYKKGFYISDYKSLLLFITFCSVLSPIYIIYKNYKSQNYSRFWNIFCWVVLIIGLLYFYIIDSLSHIGF